MNKKCPQCGMINFAEANSCKRCQAGLFQAVSSDQAKDLAEKMFCKDCGALTIPSKPQNWDEKDSLEKYLFFAWLFFFLLSLFVGSFLFTLLCIGFGIAGVIYKLTAGSGVAGCSVCGAKRSLIPADSPIAQQFLNKK